MNHKRNHSLEVGGPPFTSVIVKATGNSSPMKFWRNYEEFRGVMYFVFLLLIMTNSVNAPYYVQDCTTL